MSLLRETPTNTHRILWGSSQIRVREVGTDGGMGPGSARDPRINLAPLAWTQEAPCWCMKGNIDPGDLVITVFIIIATVYCILTTSECGTMLSMLLTLHHLTLKIAR